MLHVSIICKVKSSVELGGRIGALLTEEYRRSSPDLNIRRNNAFIKNDLLTLNKISDISMIIKTFNLVSDSTSINCSSEN